MSKNKNRQPGRNEQGEKPKDIPVFRPFTPPIDNYVPPINAELEPVRDEPIIDDDPEPFVERKIDPFDTAPENSGAGAVQVVKTVIETAPKPKAGACHMCGHVSSDALVGEKVSCPNCGHTITLV